MARPYIRMFAATDESAIGLTGLEYLRAFIHIAPVLLITTTTTLNGSWSAYASLQDAPHGGRLTGPFGQFVNVVCCDPARWTWTMKLPARASNDRKHREVDEVPQQYSPITGRRELYTVGVRNVLIGAVLPRNTYEVETAVKYELIVVPTPDLFHEWVKVGGKASIVSTPVTDYEAFRNAILGTEAT